MPVRFTSPSLGGRSDPSLTANQWQVGVAYRRLTADQWLVGKEVREDLAPFGKPLYLDINSLDLTFTYGITDRLRLSFNLPFQHGTHERVYADQRRHLVSATGLGDVNLIGTYWLRDPKEQPGANLAIGIGLKAPTGNHRARDDWFLADGTSTQWFVDQGIQRSDGGWGAILQMQATARLLPRIYGYVSGSYLVNPRKLQDVTFGGPGSALRLAVPDLYMARAGFGIALVPALGISASLGGRFDGTPMNDLIGGAEAGFRRPAVMAYLDPAISLDRGRSTFTAGLPVRFYYNFRPGPVGPPGGDLSKHLLFLSYTYRF